jgi:hypothetical protein
VRRRLSSLLEFGSIRDALEAANIDVEQLGLLPTVDAEAGTLERLWQDAREHGEASEPDHEIGDLQELSQLCLELLSPEQSALIAARLTRSDDA